jgi:hypothetical protein
VTIWATLPARKSEDRRQADRVFSEAQTEIALGRRLIKAFIEANGGKSQQPDKLEGEVKFCFRFPVAPVAA